MPRPLRAPRVVYSARVVIAWATLLIAAGWAGDAGYQAPASCPAEAFFWDEVRAHAPAVGTATAALGARVRITSADRGFVGETSVHRGAVRRLTAASCEDLVRGLALATALLVDADARRAHAARAEARAHVRGRSRGAPPAPPAAPAPPRSAELSVGLHAGVAWGVVPGGTLVVPLFAEVRWPGTASLRLSFRRATEEAEGYGRSSAYFSWSVARAEACPLEYDAEVVSATACALIEGGVADADTVRVLFAVASVEPWLATGALGRLRFPVLDGQVFLEASAGLTVPLLRYRYRFGSDTEVFRTGVVAGELGGGAGLVF